MELHFNSLKCILVLFISITIIELQGFLFSSPITRAHRGKLTNLQKQPYPLYVHPGPLSIGMNYSLPKEAAFMDLLSQTNEILSSMNNTSSSKPVTLTLSFGGSHKQTVLFNNTAKAEKYLSLPTNQYSVLNGAMVKRSIFNEDDFELSLPLRDFILNYENTTNDTTFHGFSKYILLTTISVNSQPKKGKISMSSGSCRFVLNKEEEVVLPCHHNNITDAANTTLIIEEVETFGSNNNTQAIVANNISASSLPDTIPNWLVWKDSDTANVGKAKEEEEEVTMAVLLASNQSNVEIIKSAIQPKLKIEMTWGLRQRSLVNTVKHSFFHSLHAMRSGHRNEDHVLDMSTERLEVDIKVGMDLDVRIHSNHAVAGKLTFLPIKLLFEKVGSFILSKLIGYVGFPLFLPLLMKDYQGRQLE